MKTILFIMKKSSILTFSKFAKSIFFCENKHSLDIIVEKKIPAKTRFTYFSKEQFRVVQRAFKITGFKNFTVFAKSILLGR
jgi:hypothetical protein